MFFFITFLYTLSCFRCSFLSLFCFHLDIGLENFSENQILSLRRDYHRDATQVVMSTHHLDFLEKCHDASYVPPGLKLMLKPQVYAADTSPIANEIAKILNAAQCDIMKALCNHYSSLLSAANRKKQLLLTQISSSLQTLPTPQVESHMMMMEKTDANLEGRRRKLAVRTERKLAHQVSIQDKATPCTHNPSQGFHKPAPRVEVVTTATARDRTTTHTSSPPPPSPLQKQAHTGGTKKKRRVVHNSRKCHPLLPLLPHPPTSTLSSLPFHPHPQPPPHHYPPTHPDLLHPLSPPLTTLLP